MDPSSQKRICLDPSSQKEYLWIPLVRKDICGSLQSERYVCILPIRKDIFGSLQSERIYLDPSSQKGYVWIPPVGPRAWLKVTCLLKQKTLAITDRCIGIHPCMLFAQRNWKMGGKPKTKHEPFINKMNTLKKKSNEKKKKGERKTKIKR